MKKSINFATALLFVVLIFAFAAAFVLLPDGEFSEEENRSLTTFPEFTWERLMDGSFSSDINEYFADQFPARNALVGVKGVTETLFGKGENNGVLLGKDGQLAVRLFTAYKSRLERTADMDYYYRENVDVAIDALNAWAREQTVPVATLLPPRSVDVAASAFSYPTEISDALHAQLAEGIAPEAGYIDLLPLFREQYDAGEYVYLKTDHHWTAYGAYLAYAEVMKAWGMEEEILPRDAFDVEQVPDFYGTTWSKAGYKFVGPDTLELWSLGNEEQFTTTCWVSRQAKGEDGRPVTVKEASAAFSGWLNRDYLARKDKYAAFLDGTHNEQTVFANDGAGRERLLVVKDSFANTMVPFLAQHFDLVIINLAGRLSNVSDYREEYGCDRVLIVYNWANLIENNNLASLR
ncbi:MAG: DHHW family protein [Eubacteriales bacterium]